MSDDPLGTALLRWGGGGRRGAGGVARGFVVTRGVRHGALIFAAQ